MIIQLFGLVLSAGITAVIVDVLISARLAAITGGVRGKPRHHVVVCGLGRVGTAVAARLKARGVPVVAIERHEDAVGVLQARQLKIPVIIAPASDASALEIAGSAGPMPCSRSPTTRRSTWRSPWWPRTPTPAYASSRGCSTTTWPGGWSGGYSWGRPAAFRCWPRRRSPPPPSDGAAR